MSKPKFENKPVRYARFRKNVITMPKMNKITGEHIRDLEGNFLAVRITQTYGFDLTLRKWKLVDTQKETLQPEDFGLVKEGRFTIVFRREAEDKLMRKFYRFFVIHMTVKLPDNKHEFILIKNNMVWYHNLLHSKVALLPNSSKYFRKGAIKELSRDEVAKMLENKEINQIFEPDLRSTCVFEQLLNEA